MPTISLTILTNLGLTLITGAIKYLKENSTDSGNKIVFDSFDTVFGGILGSVSHEGYSSLRDRLASIDKKEQNADIERCSRHALLNALVMFAESCLENLETTDLSSEDKKLCAHFLKESQKHFHKQVTKLADISEKQLTSTHNVLSDHFHIEQILQNKHDVERINEMKVKLTEVVLKEFTYKSPNILFEQLKTWIPGGLPNGRHWFVYYVHEFHSNLKKDKPSYCKNARTILKSRQLADIIHLTTQNLASINKLMSLTKEIGKMMSRFEIRLEARFDVLDKKLDFLVRNSTKEENVWDGKIFERLLIGSFRYYEELNETSGPYHHLNIVKQLLTDVIDTTYSSTKLPIFVKDVSGNSFSLHGESAKLWLSRRHHTLIVGDGGMGKTTSLLNTWRTILDETNRYQGFIPVFIRLNEYNSVTSDERLDFIAKRIIWHYLKIRKKSDVAIDEIWQVFMGENQPSDLKIILLLDGLNEVTTSSDELRHLLHEMNEIYQKGKSVKMVISSRYRLAVNWLDLEILELQFLKTDSVKYYLTSIGKTPPSDGKISEVINNPMMLTLYASSTEIVVHKDRFSDFEIKPWVNSRGEIFWNFFELQLIAFAEQFSIESFEYTYHKFILRHLLPVIGYVMESNGKFIIDEQSLRIEIDNIFVDIFNEDFFLLYPEFVEHLSDFSSDVSNFSLKIKRFNRIVATLVKHLRILKGGDQGFEFVHQHFRDFFSAAHICNEIQSAIKIKNIPNVLVSRAIPRDIRDFIGEILGEHHISLRTNNSQSFIKKLLGLFRKVWRDDWVGYAITNIVDIVKDLRGNVGGYDFTALNCSRINLRGNYSFEYMNKGFQSADFSRSLIKESSFIPSEHSREITYLVFHPNTTVFLSASKDSTIKSWDLTTGLCLNTYEGHLTDVRNIVFLSDGKSFLSSSEDGIIKRWDYDSSACIQTYFVNSGLPWLHPNGELYYSDTEGLKTFEKQTNMTNKLTGNNQPRRYGSGDYKVVFSSDHFFIIWRVHHLEYWSMQTGKHLLSRQFVAARLTDVIFHIDGCSYICGNSLGFIILYSPNSHYQLQSFTYSSAGILKLALHPEGKILFAASDDQKIRVWDLETKACISTYSFHDKLSSLAVNESGKLLIAGYDSGTIQIWDLVAGHCIRIIRGLEEDINSLKLDSGGNMLAALCVDTIKVWDWRSGICLNSINIDRGVTKNLQIDSTGRYFVTEYNKKTIRVWDLYSGTMLRTIAVNNSRVSCFAINPTQNSILVGTFDGSISIYNMSDGECLLFLSSTNSTDSEIKFASFASNGQEFVCVNRYNVQLRNSFNGELMSSFKTIPNLDRERIKIDTRIKKIYTVYLSELIFWDIDTGISNSIELSSLYDTKDFLVTADGKMLVTISRQSTTLKIWNLTDFSCKLTVTFTVGFKHITPHPNGKYIFLTSNANAIILLNIENGKYFQVVNNRYGILLSGCKFSNLHPESEISDDSRKIMRDYGAIFTDDDNLDFNEAVSRIFKK